MKLIIEKGKKRKKIEVVYDKSKVVIGIDNDNLIVMSNSDVDAEAIKKYVNDNLEEIVQDLNFIIYLTHQLVKKIVRTGVRYAR